MSHLPIVPFEGLGNLRFGMSRDTVRSLLGNNFESFRRGNDTSLIDAYGEFALQLSYDTDDRLEFIEAVPPQYISTFQGVELKGNLGSVVQQLAQLGYKASYDDEGCSYDGFGFGLYAPMETIEAVSIYRRGYYE